MKRFFLTLATGLFISTFLFSAIIFGQLSGGKFAQEMRPFDFTDRYYEFNGLIAPMFLDRRNGADGKSVFDFTDEPQYRDVRITATEPAYSSDGAAIFWNYYAAFNRDAFANDLSGSNAVNAAFTYPLYLFPSTTVRDSDRQAALIKTDDLYFEKNPVGVAAVMVVEYTSRIFTKAGQQALQPLALRNGLSLDGTPIIKTFKELDGLLNDGLVTIRHSGTDGADRPPYAVAKIIQYPQFGGIAPDAFLNYVKQADGESLKAETHLVTKFECFQNGEGSCF